MSILKALAAASVLALTAGVGAAQAEISGNATTMNLAATAAPTPEAVAGLFDRWNAALQTRDPARVAALYVEKGGVLLPTVSNKVRDNRAEIEDYFVSFLQYQPVGTIDERYIRILDANHAIDSGIYTFALNRGGKVENVQARYSFLYRKMGDEWQILEHHSSAMPEPTS